MTNIFDRMALTAHYARTEGARPIKWQLAYSTLLDFRAAGARETAPVHEPQTALGLPVEWLDASGDKNALIVEFEDGRREFRALRP